MYLICRNGRIPGPAGEEPEVLVCSPEVRRPEKLCDASDTAFFSEQWLEAVEATKFSFFEQNGSILDNNTVYGALNLRQSNKIDKLLVYVSQMSLGFSGEAFLYLKDPSGRISGTVTKEAVDKCQGFLKRGTVILLQNVTVIKTSLPNSICHLCIAFKNIVRYFLPRRKQTTLSDRIPPRCRLESEQERLTNLNAWQQQSSAVATSDQILYNNAFIAHERSCSENDLIADSMQTKLVQSTDHGSNAGTDNYGMENDADDLLTGLDDDLMT